MAYAQPDPALPSPSHPMAHTGYGKRVAADEDPRADADFAHLLPRDRDNRDRIANGLLPRRWNA
ncbi:hypothetical protein OG562_23005 [Streptomyces sp. NBC_01275]|uniref:hypothetical protein n=1 Tax=Streptomyces sp. NBC_01275 TaxID=2903807 RepID=UPI00224CD080|nr:hypothetical protein [Streptomyces sp. NBC_01275]MCX4763782.1 hypothetical protein [Streptomyces sp. NBC_01275]